MARRAELEQAQIIKEKNHSRDTRARERVVEIRTFGTGEVTVCGMFSAARNRVEVELREIMKISRSSCE